MYEVNTLLGVLSYFVLYNVSPPYGALKSPI